MFSVICLLPSAKSLRAISYNTESSVVPRLFISLMLLYELSALALPEAASESARLI